MTLLEFLDQAVNEYYASKLIVDILKDHNFQELKLSDKWHLEKGMNYYLVIDETSVIAFKMGENDTLNKDSTHFQIMASHLDSPVLKLKPNAIINQGEYAKLNLEVYGGPILYTWFDKPLGLAGRVMVKENDKIATKLVNTNHPLAIIPIAPIHLKHDMTQNPQKDLLALLSLEKVDDVLSLIEKEFKIEKEKIVSFDLNLYNYTKAFNLGLNNEFIASARIDNLECAYSTLLGFLDAKSNNHINVYVSFNNEEVGSNSKQGADSTILKDVLLKIINDPVKLVEALARSFIVSCDNAHAYHPNYPELYDPTNMVHMNKGIVIKHNYSMRYTTDALSEAVVSEILKSEYLNFQHYTNRSDIRGGSTLGAISESHISIPSADIGLAQLAMHSTYETTGALDYFDLIKFAKAFYTKTIIIDKFLKIEE